MKITKKIGGATLLGALGTALLLSPGAKGAATQSQSRPAPEITGTRWFNTPSGKPLSLAGRRGKVTVVEFWTFDCSNCRVNLPAYERWEQKFASQGVEVIGVHTPETDAERNPKNVERFVRDHGITYPVVVDEGGANWNRWNQRFWPTVYIVDKEGRVRSTYIGELHENEAKATRDIETLLREPEPQTARTGTSGTPIVKVVKTDAQWKTLLSPASYNVLRQAGTEAAFSGDYHPHGAGIYKCAGCGLELFDAATKFDSGTGWPSFYQPIKGHVEEHTDPDGDRTEVVCARCGGHLGHVFDDGPKPTGLRYCMNSVALEFDKK